MVAMNAQTYARDIGEVRPGGYVLYDSTWPRPALLKRDDVTFLGVPLAQLCNENFDGVRERILMKNIAYAGRAGGAARHRHGASSRALLDEKLRARSRSCANRTCRRSQLGYDYARATFRLSAAVPSREDGRRTPTRS